VPRPRRPLLPVLAVCAVVALPACGGSTEQASPPAPTVAYTAGDVPVVQPGRPGEPSTTVAPGESGTMANPGLWNQADVDFVTAMAPHHAQALDMAALAPERAEDERVRNLADRIAAEQGPEIEALQAWLVAHGLPEADLRDHGHDSMRGMATTEQMLALDAARGAEFDRLFLELMTAHHEGALQMAAEAGDARNPLVVEMAEDTAVKQSVEIDRMQQLLAAREARPLTGTGLMWWSVCGGGGN
jgi:uncharacterized protein (DUF305 family)